MILGYSVVLPSVELIIIFKCMSAVTHTNRLKEGEVLKCFQSLYRDQKILMTALALKISGCGVILATPKSLVLPQAV